jgi:hypothetical protein
MPINLAPVLRDVFAMQSPYIFHLENCNLEKRTHRSNWFSENLPHRFGAAFGYSSPQRKASASIRNILDFLLKHYSTLAGNIWYLYGLAGSSVSISSHSMFCEERKVYNEIVLPLVNRIVR